jgi:carbonic anhydrase/acetyltransferase-like protein (isoleucine patch superfamily)
MVLDRVKIGSHCIIAAGALVPPGKVIPDGSVVMGAPGQIVRQVNDRDLRMIAGIADHYMARIKQYRRDLQVDERAR